MNLIVLAVAVVGWGTTVIAFDIPLWGAVIGGWVVGDMAADVAKLLGNKQTT